MSKNYTKCVHWYQDEQYTDDDFWLVDLCDIGHKCCILVNADFCEHYKIEEEQCANQLNRE